MAEGSVKVVLASVALAVGAGVATAWFMVPRLEPPGGPVVAGPDLAMVAENRKLRDQVVALQRDVTDAKLQLAASKAFPRSRNTEDPETARMIHEAEEASLRGAIERASREAPFEQERRDAVVSILLDVSGRMRKIQARVATAPAGDRSAAAEVEDLGRETRRRLESALSPAQLAALDHALGGPGGEDRGAEDKVPAGGSGTPKAGGNR